MGNALEEHFGYLSDAVRRERFEGAVAAAVNPVDTVVDIGCGFGILGLMCLDAGASHVWGIDRSEAIEIARETMRRIGLADRYTCLKETSFQAELPHKVDIVICDHVGYFGIDYGIIKLLDDARRRFLKPDGKVMPAQLILQVAAVQSPECRALAQAWASEPIRAEFRWLQEYGVNSKHPREFSKQELAAAPAELGRIDLRNDSPDLLAFTARLEIDRTCELDGLAGRFACEIFEGVWMTNSPLAEDRIKRAQVFLPFATPLAVRAGDTLEISISVRHEVELISWSARVKRTGQSARQSTWTSTILDPKDRIPAAKHIPHLSRAGEARRTLLELIDGTATSAEIEQAMLRRHADLFPSAEQATRFVRFELNQSTR